MASGDRQYGYNIKSNKTTDEVYKILDEVLTLNDQFKKIENGGTIKAYRLYFYINATEENEELLYKVFGKNWKDKFLKKVVYGDGPEENNQLAYFMKSEYFNKITGAQCKLMMENLQVSMNSKAPDCWGDMLLMVALVVAGCVATDGAACGGLIGLLAATVTIYYIVTRKTMSRDLQIALLLIGGYEAYQNLGTATIGQSAQIIINTTLPAIQMYEQHVYENKMDDLRKEQEKLEAEWEAEAFKGNYNFMYREVYDYVQRDSHRDPYKDIRKLYIPYTSYPEVGMKDTWRKIENI